MATIRTMIELQDGMTSPIDNMVNSLNHIISAFESVQRLGGIDVDMTSITAAKNEIQAASDALERLKTENAMVNVDTTGGESTPNSEPINVPIQPQAPDPLINTPEPVELPVTWNSNNFDVFSTSGAERYEQEMQSLNQYMQQLYGTQQLITQQAVGTKLFPENMVTDLTQLQGKVEAIRAKIQQIENNPINIGSDAVNAQLEQLRGQLHQMVATQNDLNSAVDNMDVSAANAAYEKLSSSVADTERYIRDNVDEQGKFTNAIKQSENVADGLNSTIKKAIVAFGGIGAIKSTFDWISNCMEGSNLEADIKAQLRNVLGNVGAAKNAFNDLWDTASEFEANGMYGAAEMLAGATELATYISDTDAIESMMGTLADYAAGMSGGGALNSDQIVEYGTQLGKALMGTYDGLKKKGFELTEAQQKIIDGTATQAEVAEELGKTTEEVAAMSEDMQKALVLDAVIGESWDGLYESMSNTPEGQISALNNAWGDVQDSVGAGLTPAIVNLLSTIRENMPTVKSVVMGFASVLNFIIKLVTGLVNVVAWVADGIQKGWSFIGPVIMGIATAVGILTTAMLINNMVQGISNAIKVLSTIWSVAHGAAITSEMLATTGMTEAQLAFNAALLASPITWIIVAIIAVIALIYMIVAAINKLTGKSISATGVIMGSLAAAGAFVWNLFLGILEFVLGIINMFYNRFAAFANFFANVFKDPIGSIIRLFGDLADNVLGIIEKIASALDFVFGSNMAETVQGWRSSLDAKIEATANKHGNGKYEDVVDKLDLSVEDLGLSRLAYSDAYNAGYGFGENLEDSFSFNMEELLNDKNTGADELIDNTALTADNTGQIVDSLETSDEELKYLRDIAERDVINRFTTAELKVEFHAENTINSEMDIDGVVERFTEKVSEELVSVAEGVHV